MSPLMVAVSPAPSNVTDGTIAAADEVDSYSFSISDVTGGGILRTIVVTTSGNLIPRLTLSSAANQPLIQSDSGRIDQHLSPGSYSLSVSAQAGLGGYRLTTQFAKAGPPLEPLPVGSLPHGVAIGDFNRDGVPDVAAANRLSATVSVLLGNGDGTFQPQQLLDAASRPALVISGDVNSDGLFDLLTPSTDENAIGLFLGNGDGTFQPQVLIPVANKASSVAVVDVNGDGIPDLAAANTSDNSVSVLLGNDDGTFQDEQTFATGVGPVDVRVGDINGDGASDMVVANYTGNSVSILLGNGDGSFSDHEMMETGATPKTASIVDMDGDGFLDLVVANYGDDSVSVLAGNGDGTFQEQAVFSAGTGAYNLEVADVNGDGAPDVVAISFGSNEVNILPGNGNGTLSEATGFAAGRGTGALAVGDLNGDGHPDVVTADFTDNALSVLLGRGDGTFATRPTPPRVPDARVYSIAVADLNGDGRPDLVADNKEDDNVSVLLQNTDGSFQTRQTFPTTSTPAAAVIADINGDGVPDIVASSYVENTVSVLLGRGDGTFEPKRDFDTGAKTYYQLTVADVNGDGRPDIVTANKKSSVSVLLNDTTDPAEPAFRAPQLFGTNAPTGAVTVADATGDGLADIVVANGEVALLRGNGDGTFQDFESLEIGVRAFWVIVDDVNRDGIADIISTNSGSDDISVLLGLGGGDFAEHQEFATGDFSGASVLKDVTEDGIPDFITAGIRNGVGGLLVGRGDGTFEPLQLFDFGTDNSGVAVADFDGDGHLDVAQGNFQNDSVTIVHGRGDGTFEPPEVIKLRKNRYSVVMADVNGDGKPDAIRGNLRQNSLSVLLGGGTGSFETGTTIDTGLQPTSVRAADFNGDGRIDLVATNSESDSVSVLLGNGDGTFNEQTEFSVGSSPRTVAVADINGDGVLDLAVSNYNDDTVSVLLGHADGSFGEPQTFEVGQRPYSLTIADIDGDGNPDIVAANSADNTISVLLGNGGGTFRTQQTSATGSQPFDVAVADVNGDQMPDVLTADAFSDTVSVLLGNGDGTFQGATSFATSVQPTSISAIDLDGDRRLDLVTANFDDDSASVLRGNGDGTFQAATRFESHLLPTQSVAADVNGDGRSDLVTVGNHNDSVGVLLNAGNGEFLKATAATDVGLRNTPFLFDINGDGLVDRVVLDRAGRILFRAGVPSSVAESGSLTFAPPVVLNPDRPARDIAILTRESETLIAAADARFDPVLSTSEFVFTVSLFGVSRQGIVGRQTAFSTTALPARLVAADLTGDGLADLIVANPLDNSLTIASRLASGGFASPISIMTGNAPSDIAVADVNLDGRPDVLVSNQASGDVTVALNNATHSFDRLSRFRAGTLPYSLDTSIDPPLVRSLDGSASLVAGDYTGDGSTDVIVVNRSTHSFTVLVGNGRGGFENPVVPLTTSTSDGFDINERPGEIVAGDFNRDGRLDVAVLMEDTGQLWIFRGAGNGRFEHSFTIPVGSQATGLAIVPGSAGDGQLDLLVGNGFGDLLRLVGRGDGTFQIQGNRVSLSVVPDLFGPGLAGVLVGNQQGNRVTVQTQSADGREFETVDTLGEDNAAQLAPGDVQFTRLARNATLPDAVVVSTGGNAVIVYHTIAIANGAPVFAAQPQTFFVGTAPASATMTDINRDGITDMLIANQGSNDVSVLFGSWGSDGTWVGAAGPRLRSGGAGPISVAARELTGDSVLDLVVINGHSGRLTVLPGVGQGFFDDRNPLTLLNLGAAIVEPPSFVGTSDAGFAVTADGKLLQFNLSDASGGGRVVFSEDQVVSARALPNGQVVVVVADGSVKVLKSDGDMLIVESVLEAQGGAPVQPSSLAVLQTAGGQFRVLVSSQGSDTVSVFAAGSTLQPGSVSIPVTPPVTASQAGAIFSGAGSFIFNLFGTGGFSLSSTLNAGLSLSGFSSLGSLSFSGALSAALVAVEGDNYSNVAVLDFGSQKEDLSGDGRGRRPWLSQRYSFGDTSPVTQFMIGLEDAIRRFRLKNIDSPVTDESEAASGDPWKLDLFQPPPPPKARKTPSAAVPDTEKPKTDEDLKIREDRKTSERPKNKTELNAMHSSLDHDSLPNEQSFSDSFWQQYSLDDDHWLLSSAVVNSP